MGLLWDLTCKGENPVWKGGLDCENRTDIFAGFSLSICEDVGQSEDLARYLESKGRSFGVFEIERIALAVVEKTLDHRVDLSPEPISRQ